MKRKKGFTLVEIMVAIAIVGILAGVVLVSMSSYRIRANAAKINFSLSSAVTSMQSCWSMGGFVLEPAADRNICTFTANSISSYGVWPDVASLAKNYAYSENNASNSDNGCTDCLPIGFIGQIEGEETVATLNLLSYIINSAHAMVLKPKGLPKTSADWYFSAENTTDGKKICCNKKMSGCKIIENTTTCNNNLN